MTSTSHPHHTAPDGAPDDSELVARIRRADRVAARLLYDRHAPRVHRLAVRICRDDDLACDLVQETFVKAFRELDRFRSESSFGTWLHRITVTTSLNAMRKVRQIQAREAPLEEGASVPSASEAIADPDLHHRVHAAIDALPESLRLAVVLHDLEGYTHAEIGTMLGVAAGTSKARLSEARALLRASLRDFAPLS